MDNTLVDFPKRLEGISPVILEKHQEQGADEIPGIFAVMPPTEGAIEAVHELSELFDVYVLSTAPWKNPSAWQHKIEWIHLHFGLTEEENPFYKRVILSHNKHLNKGDCLIDDRMGHSGAGDFEGEKIEFGSRQFPDCKSVVDHLRKKA